MRRAVSACCGLLAVGLLSTIPAADAVDSPPAPAGSWLIGDTHVHTDHSSDGSLPRQGLNQQGPGNASVGSQIGFAERAGLQFLPLTDHRNYDQQWDPQWTSGQLLLIPGEEANGAPHATVMGAVDQVVDGKEPAGAPGYRHLQQSVWDLNAQDASWSTAHPDDGEVDDQGRPNERADLVGIDRVEIYNSDDPETKINYAEDRWNHGYRFGVVAASDSHFTELNGIGGPGTPPTRVLSLDGSERAVLDGLRAGRTTVSRTTTGTEATLLVDRDRDGTADAVGGDELLLSQGRQIDLQVHVRRGPGTTVYVYRSPGRSVSPVASYPVTSDDDQRTLTVPVPAGESWYRVEVRGPGGTAGSTAVVRQPGSPPVDESKQLQAATSPIFLSTIGPAVPLPQSPPPVTTGVDPAVPVLAEPGLFTGFADLAVSGDIRHVVAERHTPGRTAVLYRRVGSGSAEPAQDLAPASSTARFPRIAARGADVWVVWQDERAGQRPRRPDVYLRHSTDAGRTWLPEVRVTAGTARAEHPDVAVTADGQPVVVWMDNRGGAFEVLAQVVGVESSPMDLSRRGKTIDPGTAADSRSARYPASIFPSVAVAPDGRLAVGWQDDRFDPDPLFTGRSASLDGPAPGGTSPDDYEVLVSTRAAGAGWSTPVNASAAPMRSDRHPSLTFDRTGTLQVAWDSKVLRAAGENLSLFTATSADGGGTFAPAQQLALDEEAMSQRPQLSVDPDGSTRAVWFDSRSADWRWKVLTATRGPAGAWSAATTLTGAGNATWPAVDAGQVVFTSDRTAAAQRDRTQDVLLLGVAAAPVSSAGGAASPGAPGGPVAVPGAASPVPQTGSSPATTTSPATGPTPRPSPTAAGTAGPSPTGAAGPTPSAVAGRTPCAQPLRLAVDRQSTVPERAVGVSVTGPAGARVEIRAYSRPSTTYVVARRLTLGGDGGVGTAILPGTNTRMFAACSPQVSSASVAVSVHTVVSLAVRRTSGRQVLAEGRLLPRRADQLVSLYRVAGGRLVLSGQTRTDRTGRWRLVRRFSGPVTLQARAGRTPTNAEGRSSLRRG